VPAEKPQFSSADVLGNAAKFNLRNLLGILPELLDAFGRIG
jgi:hypothetical protein